MKKVWFITLFLFFVLLMTVMIVTSSVEACHMADGTYYGNDCVGGLTGCSGTFISLKDFASDLYGCAWACAAGQYKSCLWQPSGGPGGGGGYYYCSGLEAKWKTCTSNGEICKLRWGPICENQWPSDRPPRS